MMPSLRPYSSYVPSGVLWLGKVPSHWQVFPNRQIFQLINESDHGNAEMLSVTIKRGVIKQKALLETSSKKDSSRIDKSAYKFVQSGDLVYNKMRAWQGAIGISEFFGIVSPAYVVNRLRSKHNPKYFHYLFRTPMFASEAERWSYGITSDMWSLRPEHFKMIYCCVPPHQEQRAIVKYLDYVDKRVRKYIRAKQKQIKLLEEMKQAIIHQAVTRGLDPTVPLKPSGFEGLGDVPEHWSVVPMKGILKKRKEVVGALSSDLLLLSLTTNGVIPRDIENPTGKYPAEFDSYQLVRPGDLIFCLFDIDETPRTVGISGFEGMITGAYSIFSCANRRLGDFIYYYFLDKDFRKELKPYYLGLRKVIQKDRFLKIKLALPPINEVERICDFLVKETLRIEILVSKYRDQITIIKQYQTRFIADIVTGKLDVRKTANQLPNEIEELLEEPDETLEEELENGEEMEETIPEEE